MPDTTNRNLNNLQVSMGDTGALLNMTRGLSQNVGGNVPTGGDLGSEIMRLLQSYQQYGQNTVNAGQQEQVNRLFQTNPGLVGASPSTQAGARNASVQALEPTIGGARSLVSDVSSAISNVQNYLKTVEDTKNKQRDDARAAIKDALTIGGADSLNSLAPEDIIALEKQAGYPKGYIQGLKQTIKERELQLKAETAGVGGGNLGGLTLPLDPKSAALQSATGRNESVLSSVPAGTAQIVKQLVDYKIPLPTGFALRSAYWQNILGLASLYDPSFDATQYNVRLKIKQDFTSGKSATNIRSLNTAIGHLNTLAEKGKSLGNSPIQLWNEIKNKGLTAVGDKRVVEFNNAANAVESELASLFKGMGASDQEIKAWRNNLNSAFSPQQLTGSINTVLELMSSRMQALESQYEVGLGKPKDFHFLNDKSMKILKDLGQNVDQLDPVSGTLRVKEKSTGRTGTIPAGDYDEQLYEIIQ